MTAEEIANQWEGYVFADTKNTVTFVRDNLPILISQCIQEGRRQMRERAAVVAEEPFIYFAELDKLAKKDGPHIAKRIRALPIEQPESEHRDSCARVETGVCWCDYKQPESGE